MPTAPVPLSFQPLEELARLLTAAGLPSSVDASDLNLPGGWVTLESFTSRGMGGDIRLTAVVYLIVPDTDPSRAMPQLAAAYNQLRAVMSPDGPVVAQGVILPSAPTEPMPALRVPVHLPGSATALPISDDVLETV